MTDNARSTDWAADRLGKAFRARAEARMTPSELSTATIDRVRAASRSRTSRRRFAYLGGLAAAALVVAVAVAALVRYSTDRTGDDATHVFGMPILTVSEAVAIRDGGVDDQELVVSGFLTGPAPLRCPFDPTSPNPAYIGCPEFTTWLMETPQSLITRTENSVTGRGPTGPALHPSFAEVDQPPERPRPRLAGSVPMAVVLIGHFDDRRATLCPTEAVDVCADTFIVDRVESVEGTTIAPSVRIDLVPSDGGPPRQAEWSPAEVIDRLRAVVPGVQPLSVVALPGERIAEIEPGLASGMLGISDRPIIWIVTGLDAGAAGATVTAPVRRTFLLVDGTAEAYESAPWDVSNIGFVTFTLDTTPLASETPAPSPTPSPTKSAGPANAPDEVLGLPVISVSEALARLERELDDVELAVRGWYVPPSNVINCTNTPADANPLRQFCSTGSPWLMDSPDVLDDPISGERRGPTSPALNPVILDDVQFPLGNPGFEPPQIPLPVVVLGHFADRRGHAFDDGKRFVVDALVWRAGRSVPPGGVVESISHVETTSDVTQRIERDLGPASTMWFRRVTPGELEATDPDAVARIPDLKKAAAVWVARRLIVEDGRTVLRTAFTVEGSDRVWTDERGGGFVLKTTIDVDLPPVTVRPVTVQIVDQADSIVGARTATDNEIGRDPRAWISRPGPDATGQIDLARGATPNELVIRWTGGACDTTWHLDVLAGPGLLLWPGEAPPCDAIGIGRGIVITFDGAVDPAKVEVSSGATGG